MKNLKKIAEIESRIEDLTWSLNACERKNDSIDYTDARLDDRIARLRFEIKELRMDLSVERNRD